MKKIMGLFILGFLILTLVGGADKEKISVVVYEKEIPKLAELSIRTSEVVKVNENSINRRFSSIKGFSGKFTKEEIDIMKKDPTKEVFISKKYYVNLDVSVPQIKATNTWQLKINEINLTGKGETICIIDTGINYSHEAFGNCYGENNVSSNCKVLGGYDFVNNDQYPLDDHGHGTHVAGIASSSNQTYKGVSPDSKIIAIKALGSDGTGIDADIIAGIDWCVNNASKFNISVISMSFGDCTNHTTYCNGDSLATPINNAVANNITVVISAGNGNRGSCLGTTGLTDYNGPTAPACIENATAVGAVNDADSINYQRGPLFELLAPGVGIISSLFGGGYGTKDGTSMATPHVSSSILLLQQLSRLQNNRTLTPQEIKNTLNNTGKRLDDGAGSGYNFSRINIYNAILSLDTTPPNITLISPADYKVSISQNQTFVCNATDWQLTNITFYLWNSSTLYYNETKNISGTSNQSSFNLSNIPNKNYEWNCKGIDNQSNSAFASSNFTITIGGITLNLLSPTTENYTNNNNTNFTCQTISDTNHALLNVTLYLWNETGNLNYNETKNISGFDNTTQFNYTFTEDGNYSWNCYGINNVTNETWAENNFTIIYDTTNPGITSGPSASVSTTTATITWTTNESSNSSITATGGTSENSTSYNTSHSILISGLSASTTYNYDVTSCDRSGNCEISTGNSFTTGSSAISSNSGGGNTGSVSSSPKINKSIITFEEMITGTSRELKKNEKIIFNLSFEKHEITLLEIETEKINLLIESDPINLTLQIGEEVKLNLSSQEYYELYIKLNGIKNSTANLTIKKISEKIKLEETKTSDNRTFYIMKEENEKISQKNIMIIWFSIWILVILIILLIFKIKENRHLEKHIKIHRKSYPSNNTKKLKTSKTSTIINKNAKKNKNVKTQTFGKR